MTHTPKVSSTVLLCLAALAALSGASAFAGRPLTVDNANVNAAGSGHVEAFYQRSQAGTGVNTYTLAPAYTVMDGVEIGGIFSRSLGINSTGLQAKIRFTPSKKDGCNYAASAGFVRANVSGAGATKSVTGLMTCNMDTAGSVHVNLGVTSLPGGTLREAAWGLAYERAFGAYTGHVEAFGVEKNQPTLQFGVRTMLTKSLQIDGTVGTSGGTSLYSIGAKYLF